MCPAADDSQFRGLPVFAGSLEEANAIMNAAPPSNKPAETAEALRGGWLHTGDLARVDADGYLTLVDRLKDVIITGGHNVYSVEVEGALAAHPGIADVAVVGRPHPDYGESIVAVITPRDGESITLDDVRAFLRDRLTGYKIPHDVIRGAIPRNPSGKVLKHNCGRRWPSSKPRQADRRSGRGNPVRSVGDHKIGCYTITGWLKLLAETGNEPPLADHLRHCKDRTSSHGWPRHLRNEH